MDVLTVAQYATVPFVALLWSVVLIRARGALYGGSVRLALILFLLAAVATIKFSVVGGAIDDFTGIIGLQVLVRDLLGVTMAALSARAVADTVGLVEKIERVTKCVLPLVWAALVVLFVAAGPERDGILHMGAESGQPIPLAYWLTYTLTYGAFMSAVVVIVVREIRCPAPWTRGRRGLLFFGLGTFFADVYLTAKLIMLIAAAAGHYGHPFVEHTNAAQAVPSALAIFFIVLGAAAWTQLQLRERWLYRRLHKPWLRLTQQAPVVVLDPPLRNPAARLNRRVHEIHEAVALLSVQDDSSSVLTSTERRLPRDPAALARELRRSPQVPDLMEIS